MGPCIDQRHAVHAPQVRMESQVIFDSCWRRFEDKYRLQVCVVPVQQHSRAPGCTSAMHVTLHVPIFQEAGVIVLTQL